MDEQRRRSWRDRPLKELSESELAQAAGEWTRTMQEGAARYLDRELEQRAQLIAATLAELRKALLSSELVEFQASPTWRLLNPSSTRKQRHAAARALAATMSTFFIDPKVRAALGRRKGGVDRWLRHDVFPKALLLAVADRERPQFVRFGRHWVDGRRQAVRPTALSMRLLCRWLELRTRRIAADTILEASSEAWTDRIRLSRRERELVGLLAQDADRANAARRMKLKPATVRSMLRRIKSKGTKM